MTRHRKLNGKLASRPANKSRRTLAKKIRELASADTLAAMLFAKKGKEVGGIERQLDLYFEILAQLQEIESGKKTRYQFALEVALEPAEDVARKVAEQNAFVHEVMERDRARYCQMFIAALDARDSAKFFEIGIALERLKERGSGDPHRHAILLLKWVAERFHTPLTIREVADLLDWPQQQREDGFARLRRLCKELKFPLAPSKPAERE